MKEHHTKNLVYELKSRGGVSKISVPPHESYQITLPDGTVVKRTGPAIILVVED